MLECLQEILNKRFDPEAAKGFQAIYQLNIRDESEYQLTINDGAWHLQQGQAQYPDIRLTMTKATFDALIAGELDAMTAYFTGKIKSRGDLHLAKRLKSLFGKQ